MANQKLTYTFVGKPAGVIAPVILWGPVVPVWDPHGKGRQ